MKKKYIFLILGFILTNMFFLEPLHADIKGDAKLEPENTLLYEWNFPINEKALKLVLLALEDLDCELSDYLEMWGVSPSKKSNYKLDKKLNRLSMKCSHDNAQIVLFFISNLLKNSLDTKSSEFEKLRKFYTFK